MKLIWKDALTLGLVAIVVAGAPGHAMTLKDLQTRISRNQETANVLFLKINSNFRLIKLTNELIIEPKSDEKPLLLYKLRGKCFEIEMDEYVDDDKSRHNFRFIWPSEAISYRDAELVSRGGAFEFLLGARVIISRDVDITDSSVLKKINQEADGAIKLLSSGLFGDSDFFKPRKTLTIRFANHSSLFECFRPYEGILSPDIQGNSLRFSLKTLFNDLQESDIKKVAMIVKCQDTEAFVD